MFDFKNGMLGVVIIALAVAGSLFGSYLAGIDTEQVEVTKYDYLADVSGLFQYDESPQYIDYDPSSNYVGYYSNDSYLDKTDTIYFPENEMGFNRSATVNNYKIDRMPTVDNEDSVDITDLNVTKNYDYRIHYIYGWSAPDVVYQAWASHSTTLSDVIDKMNIPSTKTNVRIDLDGNWNEINQSEDELSTIVIIPKTQFISNVASLLNPTLDMDELRQNTGMNNVHYPIKSFIVDLKSNVTKCFDDNGFKGNYVTVDTDSLIVCYGPSSIINSTASYDLDLGTDMDYETMTYPPNTYLDPNTGVWLKDE